MITMFSALVGAAGVILGSLITTLMQKHIATQTAYFQAKLKAYAELEAALKQLAQEQTPEAFSAVYGAVNCAALVASSATLTTLNALQQSVLDMQSAPTDDAGGAFQAAHVRLLHDMRRDLNVKGSRLRRLLQTLRGSLRRLRAARSK